MRDHQGDALVDKRTLVVVWGPRAGRWEFTALVVGAYCMPAVAWAMGVATPGWFAPWLSAPWAARTVRFVWRHEGAGLGPALGQTARLEAVFATFLALGIAAPWSLAVKYIMR